MFMKILYPTDFSDVAAKAMDYIKQLKEAGSQEVVLLHVINQRIIDGLMRHAIRNSDIELWRKKAEEIALEEEEDPSIIVIGSHGRSNIGDIFLGSVSDRVVHKCKRPVMVIKRDSAD